VSVALATSARVVVPAVPPNWSQSRGHSARRDAEKAVWRDLAWRMAMSARHAAGWPAPVPCEPPARRYLEVAVYKRRPLYDGDGCVAALKPLIDGACGRTTFPGRNGVPGWTRPGALAWDDSPDWLGLITAPADMQRIVATAADERVVLAVHLVDPRRPIEVESKAFLAAVEET